MTQPFTDADVELAANALDDEISAALTWGESKDASRAVLSALAAAGRLTPADAETRTEWGVRLTWDDGRGHDDRPAEDEADARYLVDYHRRQKVEQVAAGRVWLVTPSLIRRTRWVGPWLPVPTEGDTR